MTAVADTISILPARAASVTVAGNNPATAAPLACDRNSLAGSVTQRACAFCGSRVILYPVADALHLVHGPIGCAAYTWDIRGAQSSGPQLFRNSFSTDLRELDVIYGGEKKLGAALRELIARHAPKAAFVYSTCIVGLIGDDVEAVCKSVAADTGIPVIPVASEGFKGTKKTGYRAACDALWRLVGSGDTADIPPVSINLLGDFNIAGETWIVRDYFTRMGVHIVATLTGDGRVDAIRRCHGAKLNLVQCSGSMTPLAKMLEAQHGIPFKRVSFFGIEDVSAALYETAAFFAAQDPELPARTQTLVRSEIEAVMPELRRIRAELAGKKAAIYVGGAFKAFSLVRALRTLGMTTALVGTQTGDKEDYALLRQMCDPGTIIVDDSNPLELAKFCLEKDVDLFIGGVKERPIAYKLGIGFCDHNHERKEALAGYVGMVNFAREVRASVLSPVWQQTPRRANAAANAVAAAAVAVATAVPPPPRRVPVARARAAATYPNATTNACKLCTPLGACLVFRGVRGAIPFLHGSQGCATYIRRYVISHFREPMDIAASNFSESSAIFGGGLNVRIGLENVIRQYKPELVGLATTCLSETIGENLAGHLHDFHEEHPAGVEGVAIPPIVSVSCASYRGTHANGFHKAVRALVETLAAPATADTAATADNAAAPTAPTAARPVALFPGMLSPADLRELRRIAGYFDISPTILPDYSDTLDGPSWADYQKLPAGGTAVADIRALANAAAAVEFGRTLAYAPATAATVLASRCGVAAHRLGMPIGVRETDRFLGVLAALAGLPQIPAPLAAERGRLTDSWVDGHKYIFEKRAVVYGEEDLVVGLAALLAEIGVTPVLCASGGRSGGFAAAIADVAPETTGKILVREGADFSEIEADAATLRPDFLLGSSKGQALARRLGVPLVRCGFPIHDRIGGQRVLHVGYAGAQSLFDRIVNAVLERKQAASEVGYSYL
ncbi:MAG: nitrogenase iron-molybdenum cofactor biosynthesis protein NifE [Puniceicoccales bacterium]|jgi:nitrogenase molybdenum-cofactor synthesis protein NifE|nr:nitrogenase iron-molybdenum cofactor biosynthesis protein NifE [Puniceicoccales bacterium]